MQVKKHKTKHKCEIFYLGVEHLTRVDLGARWYNLGVSFYVFGNRSMTFFGVCN